MNTELKAAIEMLEKEKNISQDVLFEGIESGLLNACRSTFGKSDNIKVTMDRETCEYSLYAEKTVVETEDDVMDPALEISLEEARKIDPNVEVDGIVNVDIDSQSFGRIASQTAKNVILQKFREAEKNVVIDYFQEKQHNVVTGTVQRTTGKNISINLGKADGFLGEKEQVPGEYLRPQDRVKVYVLEVRSTNRGARIYVSRTHPELVRRLFEEEVTEIRDGIVEIKSIAREAGSRTKIAVASNDPNVDPVGACVGLNGIRVNNIVEELRGEKIDIVNWDENPGNFIQNALSPAKIVAVFADPEENSAKVVVPDYQLSLAIGKEGQNARLAAKLTGFKIDIKNETQAKDAPGFRYEDYLDDEDYEDGEGYYEDGEYAEGEYVEGEEAEETVAEEISEEAVAETAEAAEEVTEAVEETEEASAEESSEE
ncbi:MAG: transcription termination/antitermination protein NusA [Lachnospiraceae bacterium]|nr:transcription termination/antitermination protein NusA [Lachnospiraceae bacterium]